MADFDDNSEITHTEVSVIYGGHLEVEDSTGRRKSIRFNGSLTAVLSTDRSSFRTSTLNISSGGALLQELIPAEFVGKTFDVLLIATKTGETPVYIMARGHALGSPLRSPRIRFDRAPVEMQETLRGIFDSTFTA